MYSFIRLLIISIPMLSYSMAYYQPDTPEEWDQELAAFRKCQELGCSIYTGLRGQAAPATIRDERTKIPSSLIGYTKEYELFIGISQHKVGLYTPWGYWTIASTSEALLGNGVASIIEDLKLTVVAKSQFETLYGLANTEQATIYRLNQTRSLPAADKETRWLKVWQLAQEPCAQPSVQ